MNALKGRRRAGVTFFSCVFAALLTACGGSPNTPNGPFVGSPGGPTPDPTKLVPVHFSVTIPAKGGADPNYISTNTDSLSIQLVSVDGNGVEGVNATTMNTLPKSRDCKAVAGGTMCATIIDGSPGNDVFAVTTYSGLNATGSVLSVGTVKSRISGGGGSFGITNRLSLTLDGVIASLQLSLTPNAAKRGQKTTAALSLLAFDASHAEIVGPSNFSEPITLAIQGDTAKAFRLHSGERSGATLVIRKPTSGITLTYDGDSQASPITVQATVSGPSGISASAGFALHGKQPPPPIGTIYALNLGSNDGLGATVTEYDGKAKGNAAPQATLQLSSKLYARSIAVDADGNLYVGYFDNEFGFSASNGTPDAKNEIAIYAPNASGNDQPKAVLTQDKTTKTTIFPLFMAFDSKDRLVTFGATDVDKNDGDAVLTYVKGASGAASPEYGWNFNNPQIRYAGPTGLSLDSAGNFYVNGALHTSLGPDYGLFVASASDIGNRSANPARTVPWDSTTELTPGLTTLVGLGSSGEIFIGNSQSQGSGSSTSCQGRVNVFAAGASGGITDNPPLRILTFDGVYTQNAECTSPRNPLVPYFPSIQMYGPLAFVADDFNNAIDAFAASGHGTVKPLLRIAGSATQLNAPIALVITSVSGGAKARPAYPLDAHHAK